MGNKPISTDYPNRIKFKRMKKETKACNTREVPDDIDKEIGYDRTSFSTLYIWTMAFWSLLWIYKKMDSKWLGNEAVSPWDLTKEDRGSCHQWSHPLSQQLAGTKTNPSKKFPTQRGFWESFTCHQPCHFLKSDSEIHYASQEKSPSEKKSLRSG